MTWVRRHALLVVLLPMLCATAWSSAPAWAQSATLCPDETRQAGSSWVELGPFGGGTLPDPGEPTAPAVEWDYQVLPETGLDFCTYAGDVLASRYNGQGPLPDAPAGHLYAFGWGETYTTADGLVTTPPALSPSPEPSSSPTPSPSPSPSATPTPTPEPSPSSPPVSSSSYTGPTQQQWQDFVQLVTLAASFLVFLTAARFVHGWRVGREHA